MGAQKGTIGFLSMGAFVGKVYGKGELSCTQVESGKSSLNDNDVYVAEASCPNDYTIFDCNGYLDSQIDYCTVDTCDSASNIKLYAADYDPMRFNVGEWSYDGEFNGYPSYAKANGNLGRDMYIYVKNGGYEVRERIMRILAMDRNGFGHLDKADVMRMGDAMVSRILLIVWREHGNCPQGNT